MLEIKYLLLSYYYIIVHGIYRIGNWIMDMNNGYWIMHIMHYAFLKLFLNTNKSKIDFNRLK